MNTDPHHVFKGHRMAGHMAPCSRTARNLRVVRIDAENNLLLVRGAVPGPNGGYVVIRQTNKVGRTRSKPSRGRQVGRCIGSMRKR